MGRVKDRVQLAALRRRHLVVLEPGSASFEQVQQCLEALAYAGYVVAAEDLPAFGASSPESLDKVAAAAAEISGVERGEFRTMYADFTHYVPAAEEDGLYFAALAHYFTTYFGQSWLPPYAQRIVEPLADAGRTEVKVASKSDLTDLVTALVASSQPFSVGDERDVLALAPYLLGPQDVPVRENLALLVAEQVAGVDWAQQLTTTTDVLRVAAALSGGDRSLVENTRFRLSRAQRRFLVEELERVLGRGDWGRHLQDMHRFRERWKRVLRAIHPQEYPQAKRVNLVRQMIHETNAPDMPVPPPSRESEIARLVREGSVDKLVQLLTQQPGDFARRLHALIRHLPDKRAQIVEAFAGVAPQVSARVLVQMWNFFHSARQDEMPFRVVLTRAGGARATFIRNTLAGEYADVIEAIEKGLAGRLAGREFRIESRVAGALEACAVPLALRSSSSSAFALARGSRVPLGEKPWLRLFLHWRNIEPEVPTDIDLTAVFFNAQTHQTRWISYTHLRDETLGAYHSGDIIDAPEGAAEYIDVDRNKARRAGYRYLVVMAYAYSRHNFESIPDAQVGVMTRSDPHAGEHYEAGEMVVRTDLVTPSRAMTPTVIDLATGELVWVDWSVTVDEREAVNVESSVSSLGVLVQSVRSGAVMTMGQFLRLTGARVSAEKKAEALDPMDLVAASALIDC